MLATSPYSIDVIYSAVINSNWKFENRLDEQERLLVEDDIVITNGKEAIGLAGVMGGYSTEIDENTKKKIVYVPSGGKGSDEVIAEARYSEINYSSDGVVEKTYDKDLRR